MAKDMASDHRSRGKSKKRLAAAMLALSAVFFSCVPAMGAYAAERQGTRIVRIPCGINDLLRIGEDGKPQGYCKDYLDELAELNDWTYEYVECTWSTAVDMLEDGGLDMIFPTAYLPERAETMDFSKLVLGYTSSGIFADPASGFGYENYSAYDGARIGVSRNSANEQALKAFAASHGFSYTPVYLDSMDEKLAALRSGTADMIIGTASSRVADLVLLSVLEPSPVYFTVKKGNQELLNELDAGMQQLLTTEPDLVASTMRDCLVGDNTNALALTDEEHDFIVSNQEITVGFYEESEPLSFLGGDGGRGIYAEILEALREESGLNLVLSPVENTRDWRELLKNGELDFFLGASDTYVRMDDDIYSTAPLLDYTNMLVIRRNSVFGEIDSPVVAMPEGYSYWADTLSEMLGRKLRFKYYDEARACLMAVTKGRADAALINDLQFNYQSKNDRFEDIVQWQDFRSPAEVGLAASTDTSGTMFTVVDKAVRQLPEERVDSIVSKYMNMAYDSYTFTDRLYSARLVLSIVGVAILALAAISAVVWIIRRKQMAEQKEQKQLLQDALEAANRASAAKSDFLSKMSHDIRTPMNAIIGMTAIASAHADDPERVRDALGKISSSSRHLLGLINEVLDMSKVESGTISLAAEEFSLSDLLNTMLLIIQPQIKEHGHKLKVHIQDIRHEFVVGDSLRIQQVFLNLMSNAVKYTPDGGEISFTVRELPMSGNANGCYEFIVEDNGIGMSEEYLEHIFEPFSRAEDLRTSKIQGTGLGMAITQSIVQLMNGHIDVESKLGEGTRFTVTIYLRLQDVQDIDASGLADLSVLVVDDDADACESVCCMLDEIGMKATGCTSGREAVEAVRQAIDSERPFYAAIVDWKMPEMDGLETAKAIKRLTGDELPIIIFSAYDWSDIEIEARAAGVDAFIAKPVFKSGLVRTFQSLAGSAAASGQEREACPVLSEDFSGRRVLLVEDNDLNREIAREILEMAGLTVEEAENGKIAVEMFSASEIGYYNMILMDIQMPVMNGYESAMAIRSLNRSDAMRVPILAMTANAFVEDIQAAKAAGMNEHLSKPIDMQALEEALKKYLG